MGMIRKSDLQIELRKVANGRKSKFSADALAEIVLTVGYTAAQEPSEKSRKREDVRFLESLYRLPNVRD